MYLRKIIASFSMQDATERQEKMAGMMQIMAEIKAITAIILL